MARPVVKTSRRRVGWDWTAVPYRLQGPPHARGSGAAWAAPRQSRVPIPAGVPAVSGYHEHPAFWPAQSLASRSRIPPALEACQVSLSTQTQVSTDP